MAAADDGGSEDSAARFARVFRFSVAALIVVLTGPLRAHFRACSRLSAETRGNSGHVVCHVSRGVSRGVSRHVPRHVVFSDVSFSTE